LLLTSIGLLGLVAGVVWLLAMPTQQITGAGDGAAGGELVVNEIDYDQPSTDTAEFLEIRNVTGSTIDLDPYEVQLINGTGGGASSYTPGPINLPSFNLAPGGYYVICGTGGTVPNCNLAVASFTIQNGVPDAVAITLGGPSIIIDTVSYGGNTGSPYTEGTGTTAVDNGTTANIGLSRFPDGIDTNNNDADLSLRCITPGQPNSSTTTSCPAAATNTPTATTAASDTPTPTASSTDTPTGTPSDTPSATPTDTPTPTATATSTPSATSTGTPTATSTASSTSSATPTSTASATPSSTATVTLSPTSTPVVPFDVSITDPFGCTGAGDTLDVEASFTNTYAYLIPDVLFQASLPVGLTGVVGSCTVSDGTSANCTVTANGVSWTGDWPGAPSAPANTITINYQVTVAAGLAPGTALCIDSTLDYDDEPPEILRFDAEGPQGDAPVSISITACGQVTCPLDPTAVRLAYFKAIAAGDEIRVVWQTESELDVLGFNILRSPSPDGPFTPVNPTLIPATGGANRGAAYILRDRPGSADGGTSGTFYYRLEDVSGGGKRTAHGPATVQLGPDSRGRVLYLPALSARHAGRPALLQRVSGQGSHRLPQ
jgi:hypothetical protein